MFPNRTIVEMKRRVGFLKDEVEAWKDAAHANQDQLGVHATQLTTLEAMMDVLLDKQAALLQALRPELTTQQFALAQMPVNALVMVWLLRTSLRVRTVKLNPYCLPVALRRQLQPDSKGVLDN